MAFNNVIAGAQVVFSANTQALVKGLSQASTSLNAFARQTQSIQRILSGLGVAFGAFQVGQFLQGALQTFVEFEFQMSEVNAITNATAQQFKALEKDAIRLGRSTVFTATEVAKLQVAYGRLGFSTDEILNATEATLNLAAATNIDLAEAADVAGSTVRGFQLDASETIRVTDVMTSSFNKSALTIDAFRESMKFVAPVANAANASVEETTALLGVLANSGIRGSIAGTSLRRIFSDLTRDGRPLRDRLAELAAKGLSLGDAYDEIGRVAQTSLLVLTRNLGAFDDLNLKLQLAAGEAERVASVRLDNIRGDVVRLTSAWEGLILSIQEANSFRLIVSDLTRFVNTLGGVENSVESILTSLGDRLTRPDEGFIWNAQNTRLISEFYDELQRVVQISQKPITATTVDSFILRFGLGIEEGEKFRQKIVEINLAATGFTGTSLDAFIRLNKQLEDARNNYSKLGDNATLTQIQKANSEIIKLEDSITKLTEIRVEEFWARFKAALPKEKDLVVFDAFTGGAFKQLDEVGRIIKAFEQGSKAPFASLEKLIEARDELTKQFKLISSGNEEELRQKGLVIRSIQAEIDRIEALKNKLKEATIAKRDFSKIPLFTEVEAKTSRDFFEELGKGVDFIIDKFGELQVSLIPTTDLFQRFRDGLANIADQGIIPRIEGEIEKLRKSLRSTFDVALIAQYTNEIAKLEALLASLTGAQEKLTVDLAPIIANALQDIGNAFATGILSAERFGDAIFNTLGNVLVQLGQIAIQAGIGVEAIKVALQTLGGVGAIAAGVALIALGKSITGKVSSLSRTPLGSPSSSSGSFTSQSAFAFAQDSSAIRLVSDVQIKGQDLYVVLSNYEKNSRNTRNG